MKKIIAFFTIFVVIIIILFIKYYDYKKEFSDIKQKNNEYESYYQNKLYGTDIATLVNRAVNDNEMYYVKKDNNGFYIDNGTNSIQIDIKILDNNTTYKMETLYNGGMSNFVLYYDDVEFNCVKIEYHTQSKKIKYLLFEQVSA